MSQWIDVGKAAEICAGTPVHVDIDGIDVAVIRIGDAYYAIEDVCTHDGGTLTGGCIKDEEIVCPRHGARFSIKTGKALSAPAYEPTATFPVRIQEGIVQVRDDRWD